MRRVPGLAFLVLAVLLAFGGGPAVLAEDLSGRVVGVVDGDTLDLLTAEHRTVRVRLAEIDAPEHDQPWGARAKQALSSLAFGREATVRSTATDRYGRTVGRVYAGGVDVNAALVSQGAAWAYRSYVTDGSILDREAEARAAGRGLWSLPAFERSPPWEWRRSLRAVAAAERARPRPQPDARLTPMSASAPRACDSRRYCRQMRSCADAVFHLKQCGVSSLDGDGDGVPCESLCRGR